MIRRNSNNSKFSNNKLTNKRNNLFSNSQYKVKLLLLFNNLLRLSNLSLFSNTITSPRAACTPRLRPSAGPP